MTDFSTHREAFQASLVALTHFIRLDKQLSKGLAKGRLEFFGTGDPQLDSREDGEPAETPKAARFLEWFALDRAFGDGAAAPIHPFVANGCPGLEPALQMYARGLADSRPGIYLVRDLDDSGMDVEDSLTGERLSVLLPDGERMVEAGDTLLGRLLPLPESDLWLTSDATERIGGSAIYDAFVEDVERTRLSAGPESVARVHQLDLEILLGMARGEIAGGHEEDNCERLEAELAAMLQGVSHEIPHVDEILQALRTGPSLGSIMGPLLEDLAFHTDLDIEATRRLLLDLWNVYEGESPEDRSSGEPEDLEEDAGRMPLDTSSADGTPMSPDGEEIPVAQLGARLLEELEAGQAKGEKADVLFARLEQMIDGQAAAEREESAGPPARIEWQTSDEGDLEALLAEYLWERDRIGQALDADAIQRLQAYMRTLIGLRIHQIQNLDELGLARSLVQLWAEGKIAEVHELMRDLVEWESWLTQVQEIPFGTELEPFRQALMEDSQRIAKIEADLPTEPVPDEGLQTYSWHVLKDPSGGWILESAEGRRPLQMVGDFVVGDLILGALGERGFSPGFRLLPQRLAQALIAPEDPEGQ